MDAPRALEGIRVIDLTQVMAGPYCCMLLGDMGADVIKVEPPEGEASRQMAFELAPGVSGPFLAVNRNKRGITLDLKQPEAVAVLRRLLSTADVLVENYRPGVMEKLGLGWEALHVRYPRLIYAATSGFGHTGPYQGYAAYDLVAQGMGGLMSLTGHPGNPPTRVGSSIGDIAAGLYTAIGINAALVHRVRTGEGMKIDVAMLDCQVAVTENAIVRHLAGEEVGPIGARHPSAAPFDAFPTKDRFMIIAVADDVGYRRLCTVLDRADLATDPRFASVRLRVKNHEALTTALSATLVTRPSGEWIEVLRAAGLPCGPINTIADVVDDPQVAARNMIVEVEDPQAGKVRLFGCPIKMSAFADPHLRATAPSVDGDRARILAELADDDEA
jgi:CoA:oxalate CoA-transferase